DPVTGRLIEPLTAQADMPVSPPPRDLAQVVLTNGIPLNFEDLHNAKKRLKSLGVDSTLHTAGMMRAWLGLPLSNRDNEAVGVLSLSSDKPGAFSPQDVNMATTIAAQVS